MFCIQRQILQSACFWTHGILLPLGTGCWRKVFIANSTLKDFSPQPKKVLGFSRLPAADRTLRALFAR